MNKMTHSIYMGRIKLHDYLFFATFERGKIAETGPFIHNYALTYALGLAGAPLRTLEQSPQYSTDLTPLNERKIYITPAKMLSGESVMFQYNSINEGYNLGRGQNIGYPNWGFIRAIKPESLFSFYVIAGASEEICLPKYIRLGKFMAKAAMEYITADRVKAAGNSFSCECILNPLDFKDNPTFFKRVYQLLPTNLIESAFFNDTAGWQAEFGSQIICLPAEMSYCKRVTPAAGSAHKVKKAGKPKDEA